MALTREQEKKLARKKQKLLASAKKKDNKFPMKIMGATIRNEKDLDITIKAIRGEDIPGFRGRLD